MATPLPKPDSVFHRHDDPLLNVTPPTGALLGREVEAMPITQAGEPLLLDEAMARILPLTTRVNRALGSLESFSKFFSADTFSSLLFRVKQDPGIYSGGISQEITRDVNTIKDGLSCLDSLIARVDGFASGHFIQQFTDMKAAFEESHHLQLQSDIRIACFISEIERLLDCLDVLEDSQYVHRAPAVGYSYIHDLQEIFIRVRSDAINRCVNLSAEQSEMLDNAVNLTTSPINMMVFGLSDLSS